MEVSRSDKPKDGYLQKVRSLATENNIILIFDECTSGFRETFGGLHKKYKVDPDIAIFAKALGNGYAISACIGRQEFMQATQKTFISSTFWTERIGPVAALKTLEVMEDQNSWDLISKLGQNVKDKWRHLAHEYNLPIVVNGLSSMPVFAINSNNWMQYKTLITQEMLKKNILASNAFYACTEHKSQHFDIYFEALDLMFKQIKECEEGGSIEDLLESEVCHSGFSRLN
jgi:glutamate-1-semialdehyde 2,1-aminomutase